MTSSISPSSQKVDDFLSKISELSQRRLRENQKTNRNLQADIDALRSQSPRLQRSNHQNQRFSDDFGVSQLSFNRSGRPSSGFRDTDSAPAMPTRPKPLLNSSFSANNDSNENLKEKYSFGSSNYDKTTSLDREPALPQRPQTYGSNSTSFSSPKAAKPMIPVKPKGLEVETKKRSEFGNEDPKPDLPTRPSNKNQAFFGLVQPVARKASPVIPKKDYHTTVTYTMPNFVARNPQNVDETGSKPKYSSFMDIENKIRAGRMQNDVSGVNKVNSAEKTETLSKQEESSNSLRPTKPLKPAKPLLPSKSSLKTFVDRDTEVLKDQIKRLSPTKTRQDKAEATKESEPNLSDKTSLQSSEISSKSLRPLKPQKPKTLSNEPEALLALSKLKKSPVKAPETAPIPEALQKQHSLKHVNVSSGKPVVPRKVSGNVRQEVLQASKNKVNENKFGLNSGHNSDQNSELFEKTKSGISSSSSDLASTNSNSSKPDFHAHLASIIRSSTDPFSENSASKSAPRSMITRASTLPETGKSEKSAEKLTHANKSRARGPKRKLPKSASTKSEVSGNVNSNSNSESFRESTKNAPAFERQNSESETQNSTTTESGSPKALVYGKPRKVPPPKAKKPNFEIKPSRNFSGEIFI